MGLSFTHNAHYINDLRVKVKGEGKNFELAECAMRRGVSVRAYGGADEETVDVTVGEGTGVFSKKAGRKQRKEEAFRKKVHKFLFNLSLFSKIEIFFSQNLRQFETNSLLLRLTKHNFPSSRCTAASI